MRRSQRRPEVSERQLWQRWMNPWRVELLRSFQSAIARIALTQHGRSPSISFVIFSLTPLGKLVGSKLIESFSWVAKPKEPGKPMWPTSRAKAHASTPTWLLVNFGFLGCNAHIKFGPLIFRLNNCIYIYIIYITVYMHLSCFGSIKIYIPALLTCLYIYIYILDQNFNSNLTFAQQSFYIHLRSYPRRSGERMGEEWPTWSSWRADDALLGHAEDLARSCHQRPGSAGNSWVICLVSWYPLMDDRSKCREPQKCWFNSLMDIIYIMHAHIYSLTFQFQFWLVAIVWNWCWEIHFYIICWGSKSFWFGNAVMSGFFWGGHAYIC